MMRSKVTLPLTGAALLIVALGATAPTRAGMRPIQEFVEAQGTYCIDDGRAGCLLFVPPVANFVGWGVTGETKLASVDYAGLANRPFDCGGARGESDPFGTTTDGIVLERPLSDGRAEITVVLHTKNALTWVADADFASGPLLFGERVCDVQRGAEASLGDSQLQLVFVNPFPGAPLPDFMELLVARFDDLVSISFRASAHGTLREAFGVDDGTPGLAIVVQTGTLFRASMSGATEDGFPAERIVLNVVGE